MELVKQSMHMTCNKGRSISQITIDDDFNVPDAKEDIDRIIKYDGALFTEPLRVSADKAGIKGKLSFRVLYGGGDAIHSLKGMIPFEELMNVEGLSPEDETRISCELEDLSITLINSRKISIRAVITFTVDVEQMREETAGVEITGDEDAQYMTSCLMFTPIVQRKKDICRIKDELELSGNKPDIAEILWDSAALRSVEIRPLEEKLGLRGELYLFVLYRAADDNNSLQWTEHSLPVDCTIDCPDCSEDRIPYIRLSLSGSEIEPRTDYDGEMRMLGIEYAVDMDICLYEEQQADIITDVYSAVRNLEASVKRVPYEQLLLRNSSKCRASDRIRLRKEQARVLQICNSSGNIRVDNVQLTEGGLTVEGAVVVSLLYAALDDKEPLQTLSGVLPFSHKIEAPGIAENCTWQLECAVEQLGAVMSNSEEIEIKAVLSLDALIMRQLEAEIITDVTAKPYDMDQIKGLPGIVGYVVKPGDTLWKIAKKFYSTVDSIKVINELKDDKIYPGDKLVLMKKVEEI